jgi:hypothetical protein
VTDEKNKELMQHLQDDVLICTHLDSGDTPFWRRTFFRTVFSMMEAINDLLCRRALEAHAAVRNGQIDVTACMLLIPRDYRLKDNGTVTSTEARRPFLSYTAFLIRTLADVGGVTKHYLGDNGWKQFQTAVEVRHRITHPKNEADMNISDDDIKALRMGLEWYLASIQDIMNSSIIFQIQSLTNRCSQRLRRRRFFYVERSQCIQ